MNKIKTVDQIDTAQKTVFVRVDFNVPLDANGEVADDTRIVAALPTIRHLIEQKSKVILASHLGRPKGKKDPRYSLRAVASKLSQHLSQPVLFVDDCIGDKVENAVSNLKEGSILLLENVRFYAEETDNDPDFAAALAKNMTVYVNDAFGSAHRAHASTEAIARFVSEKASGFLMEKELSFLGDKTAQPERPFVVILGGAKVSDKINVIDALLDKANTILIGGAMAYTFKLALGQSVGESLCEPDKVDLAHKALDKAKAKGVEFLLPVDNVAVDALDFDSRTVGQKQIFEQVIPKGWEGVDIGPKTTVLFTEVIQKAGTILWNGPMGIFEIEACNAGTLAIAKAVASNEKAISIIGGGDSVKAINESGYSQKVSFISTGGGASLEFLEGKALPGVKALETC